MRTYAPGLTRLFAGVLALALAGSAESVRADSSPIVISLDRARIIKVPDGTQTLIIGNPLVADVTMLKGNGSMIITGRSFGVTNLISLDSGGKPIDEATIKVTPPEQSLVVMRGTQQESYSCNPRCSPVVTLGDDAKYMNDTIANAKARIGAVMSGGK